MKKIINKLPKKYRWTIHNLIAHPLMEIVHILGATELGNKIHDITAPSDEELNSILNPERND